MESENFDIIRFAVAMVKKIWIVLVAAVLGFVAASPFVDRKVVYSATATIYAVVKTSYSEVDSGRDALQDYVEIILSHKVASRAVTYLKDYNITPEMLPYYVTPEYVKGSALLAVNAVAAEEQMAIDIANAVQDAFLIELNSITGIDSVRILDYASPSSVSRILSSRSNINTLAAAAFGFIAFVVVALIELFDNRIRTIEDAALGGKINVIGVIPSHKI